MDLANLEFGLASQVFAFILVDATTALQLWESHYPSFPNLKSSRFGTLNFFVVPRFNNTEGWVSYQLNQV